MSYVPVPKDYMGDGVYIEDQGYYIVLTTEDGISAQNTIAIEDVVWTAIQRYMKRVEDNRK